MQGFLEINEQWTDINSLVAKDANGNVLSLGAASGDTIKLMAKGITNPQMYAGSKPLDGYSNAGVDVLPSGVQVIYGIPAETVWVRGDNGTKIGFTIIKG